MLAQKLKNLRYKSLSLKRKFLDPILQQAGADIIHVIGDSHSTLFQYIAHNFIWINTCFEFCIVQGATAIGLANPHSKTQAFNVYNNYIRSIPKNQKKVHLLFCLGEVDCGFVIWYRAQKYNVPIETQFQLSLSNYLNFIDSANSQGFNKILVCSTPLPTILENQNWGEVANNRRKYVKATLYERTNLTMKYNSQLQSHCKRKGYDFIDLESQILNKSKNIIGNKFRNQNPLDHHLNSTTVSPLLIKALKQRGYW